MPEALLSPSCQLEPAASVLGHRLAAQRVATCASCDRLRSTGEATATPGAQNASSDQKMPEEGEYWADTAIGPSRLPGSTYHTGAGLSILGSQQGLLSSPWRLCCADVYHAIDCGPSGELHGCLPKGFKARPARLRLRARPCKQQARARFADWARAAGPHHGRQPGVRPGHGGRLCAGRRQQHLYHRPQGQQPEGDCGTHRRAENERSGAQLCAGRAEPGAGGRGGAADLAGAFPRHAKLLPAEVFTTACLAMHQLAATGPCTAAQRCTSGRSSSGAAAC